MAYGLKTHEDKAVSWKTWRNGLNTFTTEATLTAKECDKIYGTHFSSNIKDSPLYRLLKSRKDRQI